MSERIEDLECGGLKIIQDDTLYTFTSDSVVLANFIKLKSNDVAVEIGGGSGVISILAQYKNDVKKIKIFEIQPEMQNLCEKNVNMNKLNDKIDIFKDDVKNFEKYFPKESVDVVFTNPPYFKVSNFSQNKVKKNAKEEVMLNASELVTTAFAMLKFGGKFYCCYSAERACEFIALCQSHNLTVKEMFFTENGKGDVKLAVFKCVKGGKNGTKVFPNLVTNDKDGGYIEKLHTKYL